jgi:hypothetical protein
MDIAFENSSKIIKIINYIQREISYHLVQSLVSEIICFKVTGGHTWITAKITIDVKYGLAFDRRLAL